MKLATRIAERLATLPARDVGVPADVRDYAIDVSEAFDTMMEVERNPAGAWQALQALAGHIAALTAQVERMRGALTPSGETKAAYMGEFSIPFPTVDEDGNEVMLHPHVPWTTIKEIMAAIRARAAITEESHE